MKTKINKKRSLILKLITTKPKRVLLVCSYNNQVYFIERVCIIFESFTLDKSKNNAFEY